MPEILAKILANQIAGKTGQIITLFAPNQQWYYLLALWKGLSFHYWIGLGEYYTVYACNVITNYITPALLKSSLETNNCSIHEIR